jgi:hypothetical protein
MGYTSRIDVEEECNWQLRDNPDRELNELIGRETRKRILKTPQDLPLESKNDGSQTRLV